MSFYNDPSLSRLEGIRRLADSYIIVLEDYKATNEEEQNERAYLIDQYRMIREDAQEELEYAREELALNQGTDDDQLKAALPAGVISGVEKKHTFLSEIYKEITPRYKALTGEK